MPRTPLQALGAAWLLALPLLLAPSAAPAQRAADPALLRAAAQLLPRVEALSGLEAKRPVHVARRTRSELRAYVAAAMKEGRASGEIRAAEAAYRRLGLLPDTPDLERTYAAFLGEQLSGYYDPRTDTLYVLADVPAAALRSILVHEMVHALQDQHVRIDSLFAAGGRAGDRQLAARAAVEGHAMLVMLAFAVEEATGRPARIGELPDLGSVPMDLLLPGMPLPALASAPRVLRDGFIFPYARGAGFVRALRERDPAAVPFGALLPLSTEQVLDPAGRFVQADAPTEVILGPVGEGPWKPVYENTLGQFELSVLLQDRHEQVGAERFATGWDGDRYLLVSDGERDAIVWHLVWDDAVAAYEFASTYRQILQSRLGRSASVEEVEIDGRPVVRIIEADDGVDLATLPRPGVRLAAERS